MRQPAAVQIATGYFEHMNTLCPFTKRSGSIALGAVAGRWSSQWPTAERAHSLSASECSGKLGRADCSASQRPNVEARDSILGSWSICAEMGAELGLRYSGEHAVRTCWMTLDALVGGTRSPPRRVCGRSETNILLKALEVVERSWEVLENG